MTVGSTLTSCFALALILVKMHQSAIAVRYISVTYALFLLRLLCAGMSLNNQRHLAIQKDSIC